MMSSSAGSNHGSRPEQEPLNAVLAKAETRINHRVSQSTTARAMLKDLQGRSFAINISGPDLRIVCRATSRDIQLYSDVEHEADAELTGSPLSLLRLLTDEPRTLINAGHISLSGNTDVAEAFQALFALVKPELEEELAGMVGDSAARQLTLIANGVTGWLRGARHSLARSSSEYLREESRQLPSAAETEEFFKEVDELTLAVDRAAARLQEYVLQQQGQETQDAS